MKVRMRKEEAQVFVSVPILPFYQKGDFFIMCPKRTSTEKIKKIAATAMFCALAYACMYFVKIPVGFLTLDVKESLIILCSLLFGPLYGVSIAVLVPLLELITISDTGLYGFLMNFASSVAFSVIAATVYKYKKTLAGAIFGLLFAVIGMTTVMMGMNLFVTPYFLGGTVEQVRAMIPTLLLPFNLIKATLNAALVLVLYKPIATALRRTRLVEASEMKGGYRMNGRSVLVLLVGLALMALSVVLYLVVLDGSFAFWD